MGLSSHRTHGQEQGAIVVQKVRIQRVERAGVHEVVEEDREEIERIEIEIIKQ